MVKKLKENEIEEIVSILRNDGVISVPTDTVFGLCCKINSKKAYEKLIRIKKRPLDKSFPVMCANEEQINSIAIVDKRTEKIIKSFMPGPITIILLKKEELPEYITNGKKTIAIRMATSKTLKKIILEVDSPVFMTSANKSGEKECNNLEEIEIACPELDGMLEGKVIFSKCSTIIDCSAKEIKVLREGPISMEQINEIL